MPSSRTDHLEGSVGARPPRPPSASAALRDPLGAALEPALLALNGAKLARQPRGHGHPVVVFPGFGASDTSTFPLRSYLRALGHDARGWGLGRNGGDVRGYVREMIGLSARLVESSGRPIPLVGWSLGGVVAREIARERPDLVEQVITFGSPVIGGPKYTRVGDAYRARGVDVDAMEAIVASREVVPIRVPITAIHTRGDGIVDWRACIDTTSPHVDNLEVRTTHFGLGIHHEVYAIVARRLATAPARAAT
jgi:pimeloyl-ACP methyl ester carboxylesterase